MFDFGIRNAMRYISGWRIYLRGYRRPLDADKRGAFDFQHALRQMPPSTRSAGSPSRKQSRPA